MEIARSPYTFTMEKDSMTLTVTSKVLEDGWIQWPTYEYEGNHYLQEYFELQVPKGVSVIKITLGTYRGVQVSKCTIMDIDTNRVLLENDLNQPPVYPYIAVTQNSLYRLKVDDMTLIDAEHGTLKFEWGYNINNSTVTMEDYHEE
ncbi:MAG: hypothetical protein IJ193_07925 [Bacilli bacterium]|nr:hypothetical protein [Bacilli bacterium]